MKRLVLVIGALSALASVGCTHVQPWQRTKLAHPTMTPGAYGTIAEEHTYAVQEGAAGGGAGGESGCGCN